MNFFDVIIIGAGASGLMSAIEAGKRGRKVLVLDHANKVGKKILMSGGGRCNFTNMSVEPENYISSNPHFCKSALSGYSQWDFIGLVADYQIPYHEREHGRLFCDDSAKDIVNLLVNECNKGKVTIRKQCKIERIEALEKGFKVHSQLGIFTTESLVIATGGLSIPKIGTTGFGYQIAKQFNHSIVDTQAGLVPFTFSDTIVKGISERLSGIAITSNLFNTLQGFNENILFTHRGLSGPAALQLSNYWQSGEIICCDLLPNLANEQLITWKNEQPKSLLKTRLSELLPKSLVVELEKLLWSTYSKTPLAEIPTQVLKEIETHLHAWQLKPSGTEGYRTAEVTLGGINTDELSSKTLQSKKQAGLFFIGEVVDVTGQLGGYNFQWAWSSAYAAGKVV